MPLSLPMALSTPLPLSRMNSSWEWHIAYHGWSGAEFGAVQGFMLPESLTPAPRGRKLVR